jgi:hypothetical protein
LIYKKFYSTFVLTICAYKLNWHQNASIRAYLTRTKDVRTKVVRTKVVRRKVVRTKVVKTKFVWKKLSF